MTTADYVAIAISPALVMALVGSLVFFLIEVLYQGQYQGRLNYVFALFIFAAVLVARISIEIGSERAALFALPLGLATFLVMVRFVEHPSPLSHLVNLTLLAVIWWCAHKLTWDCTVIDDDQDASGKGLLQHVGVDEPDSDEDDRPRGPVAGNELAADAGQTGPHRRRWWQRLTPSNTAPHAPGLWVVYFSLAALPLFGIGQHWVPPSDVGRRRYVFVLLLVYVAAGLALLVTTSFLGLRRYLRQRRLEMPAPMAANWIAIGAVLIAIVMLLAALIPRPDPEYAISQVPWQARSPDGLSSSRFSFGSDAANSQDQAGNVVSDDAQSPDGNAVSSANDQERSESAASGGDQSGSAQRDDGRQDDSRGESSRAESGERSGEPGQETGESSRQADQNESSRQRSADNRQPATEGGQSADGQTAAESSASRQPQPESADREDDRQSRGLVPEHAERPNPLRVLQKLSWGGLAGLLKLVFYVVAAVAAVIFLWTRRHQLAQALADILREIRALVARLFGGRTAAAGGASDDRAPAAGPRPRHFAEFQDPFATGRHSGLPPDELVRYTFEAFEAWARDHGSGRTPDQTPYELVRAAIAPQMPIRAEARRLARLYSEAAYARGTISRAAANGLQELWRMMRAAPPPVTMSGAAVGSRDAL